MAVVANDGQDVVPSGTSTVVRIMSKTRRGGRKLTELEANQRIRCLLELVEELREVHPRMELGQLKVLLQIFLNPGMSGADLLEETDTDMTKSGLYKTISVLSDDRSPGSVKGRVSGLGLVTKSAAPWDGRVDLLITTGKGAALKHRLANIMAGVTDDGED